MVTLAALFAVLAVAVPTPRSASADGPSVSITISDPNYETATATITATGVTFDDWTLRVEYETLGEDPYDRYTESKPEFTASDLGSLKFLADYDDDADTLSSTFTLQRLVPDSDYTVLVKLSSSSSSDIYTDTDTFRTESGCHQEEPGYDRATDPAQERDGSTEKWFGGFNFSKVTRYELVLDVYVSNDTDLIPRNSGRCVYYNYDYHDGAKKVRVPTTGWDSAYVYVKGAGVRAWIKPTPPLIPGTFYDFHVNFDPLGDGAGMGTGTNTLAPALIINVDPNSITQTEATVTVTLPSELQEMDERMIHLVYFKTAEEYDVDRNTKEVKPTPETTVDGSTSFDLENLSPGTHYKVEASLMSSFPTYHTASKTFTTKLEPPGKPTDLEVAPGDRQLEVSWNTPAAGGVVDEYIVQWKSGSETFADAETDGRQDTVTHVSGTTTYETIISGLLNGTEYTVHVIAKNESDQAISDTATGTPDVLPEKPTIQSVVEGHTQIVVTWDEPANTGSDITGYVVQWKDNSVSGWESPLGSSTLEETDFNHTITSLANETEYAVRVRAVNGLVLPVEDEDDYNWSDDETGTPVPDPSVSLTVKERSQTGATLTANIEHGNNVDHTAHLRFREKNANPPESWPNPTDEPSYNDSAEFTLSSLKAGTTYEVQAWLNDDSAPPDSDTFEFYTLPVVEDITFSDETRVSATATVSLTVADIDTSSYTVHLRYRKKDASPPDSWSNAPDESTSNGSAEFTLSSLDAGSTYEVQAWLDEDSPPADSETFDFYTLPAVTDISFSDETQVSATAMVSVVIADASSQNVHLRYRRTSDVGWTSVPTSVPTTGQPAEFLLSGLTSGTTYQVQAWLNLTIAPANLKTYEFTTDPPSVSGITFSLVGQTGATANITIAQPNRDQQTVKLQYSVKDEDDWSEPPESTTSKSDSATIRINGLTSQTEYEVRAWLNSAAAPDDLETYPLETLPPSVSDIDISDRSETGAKATIKIAAANDKAQTVNLRYKKTTDADTEWESDSDTTPEGTKTESKEFSLLELDSGTTYEVEAWLDSSSSIVSDIEFNTLTPDPSVSDVEVDENTIAQTSATATVTIANPGTAPKILYLQYSIEDADDWTEKTEPITTEESVDIVISPLKPSTMYEVQASLNSDYSAGQSDEFKTLPLDPSIEDVTVGTPKQTEVMVTVKIENPGTSTKIVHLEYGVKGEGDTTEVDDDTPGGSISFTLRGLDGNTEYEVTAWLARDDATTITRSFWTAAVTPGAPSITGVTDNGDGTLTVEWDAPEDDGGATITAYKVEWDENSETGWNSAESDTTRTGSIFTHPIDRGLTNGILYKVQVSAVNSAGTGAASETETRMPTATPGAPSVRITNEGDATLTVTWIAPIGSSATGGSPITGYKVQWKESDESSWTSAPTEKLASESRHVINGLVNDKEHTVQVFARNKNGLGTVPGEDKGTPSAPVTSQNPPQNPNPPPNNPPPQRSPVVPVTPPPKPTPASVTDVTFGNITQTSADATVAMSNEGKTANTLRLRYREEGATSWDTVPARITSGTSETFSLTTLRAGTKHEVQAWLDSSLPPAGTKIYEFDTLDEQASAPDAAISNLKCENIGQTSATAMVEIANAGTDMKQVFLKHSIQGEDEWTMLPFPTITYDDDTSIPLTGLTEGTTYEVAVALSNDFSGMVIEQCTTLLLDPVVSGISVDRRKQTSVWANVSIANANGEDQTVHLRYRTTTPQGEWSDSAKTTTSTDSASKEIAGLTADTEYEVQASLDSTFPDELTKNATFTTLRFPSISNLEVEDETKNSATAVITIADPDGSSQTIHLRYRTTTPQGEWSSTPPGSSTTSEASIALTGLAPDTEYEAEVSLTSDFTVAVSDVFRTLPPDPVVSKVSVNSIRQTTATAEIDIANANGSTHTVSLRYRTTTPRGDWSGIKTTTSDTDSASIDLSELTPGTEYDVQASLENSFPSSRTKHDTFTTLRWPSIASFEVENVDRNGATVNATISDSHGVRQTVYVRHRATSYIAWRPTQQGDSVDDVVSLRLRGLSSGTEYAAEASLDESFPSDETRSVTFTTVKRKDDDDASSSGSGTVQAARAENIPLLGFSPQMLRFTAIEGGDNPAPQTFSVWNRAQGTMNFTLSNHEKWLSQDPTSGVSTGPADVVAISASVDISGLPEGQYVDVINIQISPAGRSPGQVIVVLDVLPPDYIRQFVSRDEGGVVTMPDGTVRLVVPPGSPPKDVDIELMKLNTEAHGEPLRDSERVVLVLDSNTYSPGGDIPEDVAYSPAAELWLRLPSNDRTACDEGKTRVYSVEAGTWSLVEHRCETDESGHAWAVTQVERLGQFALVIDDAPVVATPTPVAAAVAPMPTAIPASAPAVAVQRVSLPAQPPTPTPTQIPTPMPLPNGKRASVQTIGPAPTQTAVPAATESLAQTLQASSEDGDSGSFGSIVLAAIGAPLIIGLFIVGYLAYRERRRTDNPNL